MRVRPLLFLLFLAPGLAAPPLAAEQDREERRLARVLPERALERLLDPLPRPLSRSDTALYRRIFALQEQGHFPEADRLIAQLDNKLLLGHVLAQRYLHPTAYRSSYEELRAWLVKYADHPQASRIYRLAKKRRPKGAPPPPRPVPGYLGGSGQELYDDYRLIDARIRPKSRWLRQLQREVRRGRIQAAERRLAAKHDHGRPLEIDLARWFLARAHLFAGRDERALELAGPAAARSGEEQPGIYWTAGLAAWRLGRAEEAARYFAALANSEAPSNEERAAAAFWAARGYLVAGRPRAAARFLHLAASASDGFYGLLAQATLGRPIAFGRREEGLRDSLVALLIRFPGSRRAMALAQVGRLDLAEAEIRKLAARARPPLLRALAALAESLELAATQLRVAQRLRLVDGDSHEPSAFPVPKWEPKHGYTLDRALLWAFARAESGFDPTVRSRRGALGLMQIMPRTAREIARNIQIAYRGRSSLLDPKINLALGQAYLEQLLADPLAGRSLIHLALAYNAGRGRLGQWDKRLARFADDPLMYIESIPFRESRLYVKKVLVNLWAYRARLGQSAPSLEALAANSWPRYVALEERDRADGRR